MNVIFINPERSGALVEWGESHQRKTYRVGYNGKVRKNICGVPGNFGGH